MSSFANSSAARKASAPSSALDITGQGIHSWDSLLSPSGDTTLLPTTQDDGLIDSPNFLLGGSAASTFHSELEASSSVAESFSWDSPAFSTGSLRPSVLGVSDLHTGLHSSAQASPHSAFNSTLSMMSTDSSSFPGYPYGAFPLLPVLPTGPYDVQTGRSHLIPDEPPVITVSPAAVSLSQVAPLRGDTPAPAAVMQIKPEPANENVKLTLRPRELSMDLDDVNDMDEEDEEEDEEDIDDGDNGDEYRERSRGRKDAKAGRPSSSGAPRKADNTLSNDGASTSVKRGKTTGSSKASGSEGGSTPAPKRRVGTRISVAEFIPPDVTGLSKREARLVKNRAAAFLSRQRKREEFEQMEVRLTEVLEENARLKGESTGSPSDEVQRLQEMLREAKEREQALKSQLEEQSRMAEQARIQAMKVEEPVITVQEALKLAHSPMVQSPRSDISSLDGSSYTREKENSRSGPGFNLMVLVFSLTLLSMPHQHQLQASMRGAGSQPTRIAYEPSGSSSAAFPTLFQNVLERWEGGSRFETVDDDEEMEVEVEPWEQEENSSSQSKSGSSYVVDFEMPVLADESGKDDDGKIKVRISPCGVPRPRQNSGGLKPGELVWDGTPLPPLETNGVDLGSGAFAADWNSWGGWQQFLSDDLIGAGALGAEASTATVDDAFSPRSDMEHSIENHSDRWATPPPFTSGVDLDDAAASEGAKTPADASATPVDVDVSLSALPAWSRAMVHAAAGEKLKARIRVSKKSKVAGRSKNTIALGKKRMGLVVKV
ncbi:hypothetical protein FRC17_005666 [Serendipita sp. 399]|nr:hypothetical protein FRC17_005666 [Serendipita sp. 399]